MHKIGDKINMLTILQKKRENNRTYFLCRCECGNEKWIRADTIDKIMSCGCYNKKNNYIKPKDITKKSFGRLTALYPTEKKDSNNGSVIWHCQCKCGNECDVAEYLLVNHSVRSCGCIR